MVAFTPKKINTGESLGDTIQQARLFKNLKIEDIAKKTGIRKEYLIAIEEERYDLLPAGLYGRSFVKEYARFLKLNTKEILKNLETKLETSYENNPFSKKIVKRREFRVFPKIIRNILLGAAILICFLYLIFYFKKIIFPPFLEITQPEKNLMTKSQTITIVGKTEKEAEVRINNEIILNNHDGIFSQTINLKKGINNIVITSKKKYSREKTVSRQILVE